MKIKYPIYLLVFKSILLILIFTSGCYASPQKTELPTTTNVPQTDLIFPSTEGLDLNTYITPSPLLQTEITFTVIVPSDSPVDQSVYLTLLDEVTGLALNSESFPMQKFEAEQDNNLRYTLTLPFPIGSLICYRYERQTSSAPVSEIIADGTPVRYRLYHVEGPGYVEDIVSRWTDTTFNWQSGRIQGIVTDVTSGLPIPNLLITAGGAQTFTSADGYFLIENLPPGTHNLVAIAPDGAYRPFQQGAIVAENSTTVANFQLQITPLVDVTFIAKLPKETPPIIPVRIAGNLYQLGNSFANLEGGISSIITNMPIMTSLPDGRYILRTQLPVGSDIRYKYTLGDGFWNAEHTSDGDFRIRQLIVPEQNVVVLDIVESWRAGNQGPLTFDIIVPENTPPGDTIAIQFNPIYGWTVPIPMWSLGNNRWAYILYSPLNLPGNLAYRFCRNGQCNRADDTRTVGENSTGISVSISDKALTLKDIIPSWSMLPATLPSTSIYSTTLKHTSDEFLAGVEFEKDYHPSWKALIPKTLGNLHNIGINTVVHTPSWTWTSKNPPVLQPVMGKDINLLDLQEIMRQTENNDFQNVLFPIPHFNISTPEWWQKGTRDFSWWLVWFDTYQKFLYHYAEIATKMDASYLIIGGDWLSPALPGGVLSDGTPSGVFADAESRWREIITNIRSRYSNRILWAMTPEMISNSPPFLDSLDGVYLMWSSPLSDNPDADLNELKDKARLFVEDRLQPFQAQFNKPIILAIGYPSANGGTSGCVLTITGECIQPQDLTISNPNIFNVSLDLQEQINGYTTVIEALTGKEWLKGIISRGYYPPATLLDTSISINGKPVQDLLKLIFTKEP